MASFTATPRILMAVLLSIHAATVFADDMRPRDGKRWWRGEARDVFSSPCETKIESKRNEYKREIKCKDGVATQWQGEWKREFRDGHCLIKQEAKRDEFKEEVKCEPRRR